MTPNHAKAAAHYAGLLDELHAMRILDAIRALEMAKRAADAADVFSTGDDYERAHHDLKTAQVELWRVLDAAGIDAAVLRGL